MNTVRYCLTGMLALLLFLAGCATTGKGRAVLLKGGGGPLAEAILTDLARNDDAIQTLSASGAFMVEGPDFGGVASCAQSRFAFRRPGDCAIDGRALMGPRLLRLVLKDDTLFIEAARQGGSQAYSADRGVPGIAGGKVTPRLLMQLLFLPEPWGELSPANVRATAVGTKNAILEVPVDRSLTRRFFVEGTPWRVARAELVKNREVALSVERSDYQGETFLFPTKIEVEIPEHQTRMRCVLDEITINSPIESAIFATGETK